MNATTAHHRYVGPVPALVVGSWSVLIVLQAVPTALASPRPWSGLLCLTLTLATSLLLSSSRAPRLSRGWALATIAVVVLVTHVLLWPLDPDVWPGYGAWPVGAGGYVFYIMAIQGRIGLAWLGTGLLAASATAWTMTGQQRLDAYLIVVAQLVVLVTIGTLFAVGLDRTDASIARTREAAARTATQASRTAAATLAREEAFRDLEARALPTLELLARGQPASWPSPLELAALEASLRDAIRAPRLASEPLSSSVEAARRRGVQVLLLDDGPPSADRAQIEAALATTARRLDEVDSGDVVIRWSPTKDGGRISVVVDPTP